MLGPWLAEGAAQLADTLRAAGPAAEMWTPVPGEASVVFWARRFTHETTIHRADATLTLGAEFTVDTDVALDALDEWMELGSLPQMFEFHPEKRALLDPGRTSTFTPLTPRRRRQRNGSSTSPAMPSPGAARMRRPPSPCAPR